MNSNARMPIGLEIDISPLSSDVFRKAGKVVGLNLPDEAGLFLDTSEFDGHPSYGAVIRNPHKLNSTETYAIVFYADGAPWYAPWEYPKLIQGSGEARLIFQASIDISRANIFISEYDAGNYQLNEYTNDGSGGGFDYFVAQSDGFDAMNIPSQNRICWYAKEGDDIGCNAGNPFLDGIAESVVSSGGAIAQDLVSSGTAIVSTKSAFIPSKGPGGASAITDPVVSLPPDYVANLVHLTTPWQTETYTYGKPERMQMHAQFENKGDGNGNCSAAIEAHFYLSKGYKEDDHTQWKRVGTDFIQCGNLTPGTTHSEEESIDLWIETPEAGIYNIVACIDHIKDDHNEGGAYPEKHESNNCSTEAVFEVTTDGQVVNKPSIDYIAHSFQFLQTPTYAGDQARFGGYIQNIGIHSSQVGIRSNYSVECPGTGRIQLTDDGTDVTELTPGANNWEQTDSPVTLPNAIGVCTAYLCADYQSAWTETNEANNCAAFSFTLYPRPKPVLNIIKFQDEVGCCTTNLGSRIKPDVWIQNTGTAAPSGEVVTMYQISSPIGTGGAWWTIGYGASQPSELPPGTTDEDYMDGGGWQIPINNAWKNQWHTVRACVNRDGGSPTCGPNDSIATYARFSKK